MFVTPNMTVLGGRGFSPAPPHGYLRTVTGYPLTLTKTLAKPPESVTVYGAEGGVGDKTVNLFDKLACQVRSLSSGGVGSPWKYSASKYYLSSAQISLTPKTRYAVVVYNEDYTADTAIWCDRIIECNSDDQCTLNHSMYSGNHRYKIYSFRTTATTSYAVFRFTTYNHNIVLSGSDIAKLKVMLLQSNTLPSVDFGDTSFSLPGREPYGYKLPIQMTTAQDTNTVKIYTDAQLGDGDVLTVNPKQSAMRNDTDISALQDWDGQDWTIPKAEELTVTADTTVEPSSMEIKYYSKNKE